MSSRPSTTPSFLLHPIAGMQEHLSHPDGRRHWCLTFISMAFPTTFVIDELHVLCRIFDVMVDNLIALAVLMDKQARDGSQHHINGLAVGHVAPNDEHGVL